MTKLEKDTLSDMMDFIETKGFRDFKSFADYCFSEYAPKEWCEFITGRYTLFLKEYINSNTDTK